MNILGINCFGHDSAASLIVNGIPIMAIEEERLNRKKHYGGFPYLSIEKCLQAASISYADLDHIGYSWDPRITYAKIPLFLIQNAARIPSLLKEKSSWSMEENLGMLNYLPKIRRLPNEFEVLAASKNEKTKFKFHFLEHHLCHAASAYYCSKFADSAILTVDGAGEWATAMLAHGVENKINKIVEIQTPHSLGAFYQAIARYLGFKLIEGPGKLMGLSSYGDKNSKVAKRISQLIKLESQGKFKIDMSYFCYHYTRKTGVTKRFLKEFGPSNLEAKNWSTTQLNIAAGAQLAVEEAFLHMARELRKSTKSNNLCIAGGVGLNSVANGRIVSEGIFDEVFVQPAAGDSGTSLGAALYIQHGILNIPRKYVMTHAFLGPSFEKNIIETLIKKYDLIYKDTNRVAEIASKMIAEGNILGWFQGKMEFGPRALGNRSILANPCLKNMKDVLNSRVKFREDFRPFAPLVQEEYCSEYFENNYPSPYMLKVYQVKPDKRDKIPSVTHVDGSGRVQTVNSKDNFEMWNLIEEFRKLTGVPILINTSFNIKGEPIVCNPEEALSSFIKSDIDFLILGEFIVGKNKEHFMKYAR